MTRITARKDVHVGDIVFMKSVRAHSTHRVVRVVDLATTRKINTGGGGGGGARATKVEHVCTVVLQHDPTRRYRMRFVKGRGWLAKPRQTIGGWFLASRDQ